MFVPALTNTNPGTQQQQQWKACQGEGVGRRQKLPASARHQGASAASGEGWLGKQAWQVEDVLA